MASGPPPSPIVHLLPIIEKLTLLDGNGCRQLLQGVSRRFPEVGLDIVHAHTPAGVTEPLGDLLTAARVASIVIGNVRAFFWHVMSDRFLAASHPRAGLTQASCCSQTTPSSS